MSKSTKLKEQEAVNPARIVFWVRIFNWVLAAPALFWAGICIYAFLWPDFDRDEYIELYQLAAVIGLLFPVPAALTLGPGRPRAYHFQLLTLTIGALLAGCTWCPMNAVLWVPAAILFSRMQHPVVRDYCCNAPSRINTE